MNVLIKQHSAGYVVECLELNLNVVTKSPLYRAIVEFETKAIKSKRLQVAKAIGTFDYIKARNFNI